MLVHFGLLNCLRPQRDGWFYCNDLESTRNLGGKSMINFGEKEISERLVDTWAVADIP